MAGPFVFFDLRTPDVAESRAFYTRLFGWTATDGPAPMIEDDGVPWAGFTPLAADDTRPPQWVPYAPVGDLDQATEEAIALGATLVRGRTELPVGSLTVIEDPAGATIVLWQSKTP
jgi:predicted enzyme related to lactoylglutathione lyase